jgi:hypothetical protein
MNDMNQKSSKLQTISSKINNSFYNQDRKLNNFSSIIKDDNKNSYNDLMLKRYNGVLSYYQTTIINLINSKEYNNFSSHILNSKNFMPKIKYFYYQNNKEQQSYFEHFNKTMYEMNHSKLNNLFFNNTEQKSTNNNFGQFKNCNYILNQGLFFGKNFLNYNCNFKSINENKDCKKNMIKESSEIKKNSILLDSPSFIPSNFNKKEEEENEILRTNSKDSSIKDKESDSTSAISEKKEEENNDSLNKEKEKEKEKEKIKKNVQKFEKKDYIVEMFGRRGWICSLCNNFNYETRNKCNRCGIVKKPKIIIDLKQKFESKESKEIKLRNENNNKDGDWICFNCRNLNYSFRNVCNRCKIPKVNQVMNNNIQKNFPGSFFIIRNNNIPNFYLKKND